LYVGLLSRFHYSVFPKFLAEFAALSDAAISSAVKSDSPEREPTMESNTKVVDYLAEELKREEERAAKQARMAKLVSGLKAKAAGAGR